VADADAGGGDTKTVPAAIQAGPTITQKSDEKAKRGAV